MESRARYPCLGATHAFIEILFPNCEKIEMVFIPSNAQAQDMFCVFIRKKTFSAVSNTRLVPNSLTLYFSTCNRRKIIFFFFTFLHECIALSKFFFLYQNQADCSVNSGDIVNMPRHLVSG